MANPVVAPARARHARDVATNPQLSSRPGGPTRVLIAGGGFAAVEAMLALRALAGDRVAIELISPQRRLASRPPPTGEPFGDAPPASYDLVDIARDLHAAHRVDRLEAVAPAVRRGGVPARGRPAPRAARPS